MIGVHLMAGTNNHFEWRADAEAFIRETFGVEDYDTRVEMMNEDGEEVVPIIINDEQVATMYIGHNDDD